MSKHFFNDNLINSCELMNDKFKSDLDSKLMFFELKGPVPVKKSNRRIIRSSRIRKLIKALNKPTIIWRGGENMAEERINEKDNAPCCCIAEPDFEKECKRLCEENSVLHHKLYLRQKEIDLLLNELDRVRTICINN